MTERSSTSKRKKRDHDFAVMAFRVVQEATGDMESHEPITETEPLAENGKNPAAVALGRLGGMKGGRARAEKLTPEQRTEIARKAATERWARRG